MVNNKDKKDFKDRIYYIFMKKFSLGVLAITFFYYIFGVYFGLYTLRFLNISQVFIVNLIISIIIGYFFAYLGYKIGKKIK
jgi:uncharacterized protein YacL